MTDIVERLRARKGTMLMDEAADEIERLLKTNEGLRREWRRTEAERDRLRAKLAEYEMPPEDMK